MALKKVFITGAPGWLGTRCVRLMSESRLPCQQDKYELRCLVLPGMDAHGLEVPHVEVVRGDVTDPKSLSSRMKGCDAVIHMAGVIHPKRVRGFYRINYEGTKNVLEEAAASGVRRLVFISSNSPMGFSRHGRPFREDDRISPYMHYGKSKYWAEKYVREASERKRLETVILRPCWYYGPGQPERQTKFFRMIKKGNPILFGDGSNERSVSYIDHVIQGIILALEKDGIDGKTYWIADERPYTTLEIYETIADLLGVKKLKPRRIPAFSSWVAEQVDRVIQTTGFYQKEIHVAGEMARNIACSVEKAKKELGYKPEISLREGMKRSIDWCRESGIEI